MTRLTFFAAVISLLLAALAVAEIKSITISDDSRPVIFLQTFGFTQTVHVTISVSSFSLSSSWSQDSSRTGFYLVDQGSLHQVDLELQQKSSFCVLDSHYVHHFNHSYQVTSPGYYSLFFANCVPGAKVSMKFTTEMYNLDPNGSKNYLPAGSTQLPDWSFVFSLCYLTFFGLWVYFCYKKKLRIHVLIAALLLMKALSLVCAAEVEFYLRTTGTPHGWNIPFYVFHFIGKVLLFVVIWSFLKPNKRMLIMVIAFQVIGVMGSIVGGETGSYIQNWIISDDSRPVIFLQTFGFTQTVHVTISVSSFSLSSSWSQDSSRTGFYLVDQGSLHQVDLELQQKSSFCVLDSHYVHHFNHSYQVTSPGYYSLFFANCVPGAKVSMKFTTEMYNLDPNGSKNYLPAGSTQLPDWSFVFSLCYLTFFGLWVYFCYNKKLRIHVLIAAPLLMKALSLVCAAEVEFYLRTTGTPHSWNIPFYVFHFIGKVLLFVVIWSFLKPNKRMLIMVIAFQVIGVMGSIVGGETGSYIQNWSLWTHIFSFGEVFCWVLIISSSSSMKRERPNNAASNQTKCRLGQDNNPNK